MPGNLGKLIKPTGFESEQDRVKRLRDMADALEQQSMGVGPLGSWTQVLAKVLSGYVSGRENKEADNLEQDVSSKILKAYTDAHQQFNADVAGGMSDADLQAKYSGNPYVEDDLKPHTAAYQKGLEKSAENQFTYEHTPTGWQKLLDIAGKPEFNPNDKLISDGKGGYTINVPMLTFDREAQANGPAFYGQSTLNPSNLRPLQMGPTPTATPSSTSGRLPFNPASIATVESGNRDFNPDGSPVTSPKGALYSRQVMPSTAANPGYGVTPVSPDIMALPNTDPRKAAAFDDLGARYAAAMSNRYGNTSAAAAAYNAGPGRTDQALRSGGNFVTNLPSETQNYVSKFGYASRPPDGMTNDGRPAWLINGQYYDNPEGN